MILIDEVGGEAKAVGERDFAMPTITIRELITARIELENEARRDRQAEALARLGARTAAIEERLNRPSFIERLNPADEAANWMEDAKQQIRVAERAFAEGCYFILLGDRQAECLDEQVDVKNTGAAIFLQITPLQGG